MADRAKNIAILLGLKGAPKPSKDEEMMEGEDGGEGEGEDTSARLTAAKDFMAAFKDDDAEALLEAFDRMDADEE